MCADHVWTYFGGRSRPAVVFVSREVNRAHCQTQSFALPGRRDHQNRPFQNLHKIVRPVPNDDLYDRLEFGGVPVRRHEADRETVAGEPVK